MAESSFPRWHQWLQGLGRWCAMLVLAGVSLQLFWLLQTASLQWWQPWSTTFQRTAIWQTLRAGDHTVWQHQTVASRDIANTARQAVIASEDNLFFAHSGVDWKAIERAWKRNTENERILGGSTISQQLAKNLYLTGERSFLRKGQELVLTWMLESWLSKDQILDIYLNQVEWGSNIWGVEAASRHYFGISAAQLSSAQAARLAVMLPSPKRLGAQPNSSYMNQRTRVIQGRMPSVPLSATP